MRTIRAVSQICDTHLMTQILTGPRCTNTSIYDDLRRVSCIYREIFYLEKIQNE